MLFFVMGKSNKDPNKKRRTPLSLVSCCFRGSKTDEVDEIQDNTQERSRDAKENGAANSSPSSTLCDTTNTNTPTAVDSPNPKQLNNENEGQKKAKMVRTGARFQTLQVLKSKFSLKKHKKEHGGQSKSQDKLLMTPDKSTQAAAENQHMRCGSPENLTRLIQTQNKSVLGVSEFTEHSKETSNIFSKSTQESGKNTENRCKSGQRELSPATSAKISSDEMSPKREECKQEEKSVIQKPPTISELRRMFFADLLDGDSTVQSKERNMNEQKNFAKSEIARKVNSLDTLLSPPSRSHGGALEETSQPAERGSASLESVKRDTAAQVSVHDARTTAHELSPPSADSDTKVVSQSQENHSRKIAKPSVQAESPLNFEAKSTTPTSKQEGETSEQEGEKTIEQNIKSAVSLSETAHDAEVPQQKKVIHTKSCVEWSPHSGFERLVSDICEPENGSSAGEKVESIESLRPSAAQTEEKDKRKSSKELLLASKSPAENLYENLEENKTGIDYESSAESESFSEAYKKKKRGSTGQNTESSPCMGSEVQFASDSPEQGKEKNMMHNDESLSSLEYEVEVHSSESTIRTDGSSDEMKAITASHGEYSPSLESMLQTSDVKNEGQGISDGDQLSGLRTFVENREKDTKQEMDLELPSLDSDSDEKRPRTSNVHSISDASSNFLSQGHVLSISENKQSVVMQHTDLKDLNQKEQPQNKEKLEKLLDSYRDTDIVLKETTDGRKTENNRSQLHTEDESLSEASSACVIERPIITPILKPVSEKSPLKHVTFKEDLVRVIMVDNTMDYLESDESDEWDGYGGDFDDFELDAREMLFLSRDDVARQIHPDNRLEALETSSISDNEEDLGEPVPVALRPSRIILSTDLPWKASLSISISDIQDGDASANMEDSHRQLRDALVFHENPRPCSSRSSSSSNNSSSSSEDEEVYDSKGELVRLSEISRRRNRGSEDDMRSSSDLSCDLPAVFEFSSESSLEATDEDISKLEDLKDQSESWDNAANTYVSSKVSQIPAPPSDICPGRSNVRKNRHSFKEQAITRDRDQARTSPSSPLGQEIVKDDQQAPYVESAGKNLSVLEVKPNSKEGSSRSVSLTPSCGETDTGNAEHSETSFSESRNCFRVTQFEPVKIDIDSKRCRKETETAILDNALEYKRHQAMRQPETPPNKQIVGLSAIMLKDSTVARRLFFDDPLEDKLNFETHAQVFMVSEEEKLTGKDVKSDQSLAEKPEESLLPSAPKDEESNSSRTTVLKPTSSLPAPLPPPDLLAPSLFRRRADKGLPPLMGNTVPATGPHSVQAFPTTQGAKPKVKETTHKKEHKPLKDKLVSACKAVTKETRQQQTGGHFDTTVASSPDPLPVTTMYKSRFQGGTFDDPSESCFESGAGSNTRSIYRQPARRTSLEAPFESVINASSDPGFTSTQKESLSQLWFDRRTDNEAGTPLRALQRGSVPQPMFNIEPTVEVSSEQRLISVRRGNLEQPNIDRQAEIHENPTQDLCYTHMQRESLQEAKSMKQVETSTNHRPVSASALSSVQSDSLQQPELDASVKVIQRPQYTKLRRESLHKPKYEKQMETAVEILADARLTSPKKEPQTQRGLDNQVKELCLADTKSPSLRMEPLPQPILSSQFEQASDAASNQRVRKGSLQQSSGQVEQSVDTIPLKTMTWISRSRDPLLHQRQYSGQSGTEEEVVADQLLTKPGRELVQGPMIVNQIEQSEDSAPSCNKQKISGYTPGSPRRITTEPVSATGVNAHSHWGSPQQATGVSRIVQTEGLPSKTMMQRPRDTPVFELAFSGQPDPTASVNQDPKMTSIRRESVEKPIRMIVQPKDLPLETIKQIPRNTTVFERRDSGQPVPATCVNQDPQLTSSRRGSVEKPIPVRKIEKAEDLIWRNQTQIPRDTTIFERRFSEPPVTATSINPDPQETSSRRASVQQQITVFKIDQAEDLQSRTIPRDTAPFHRGQPVPANTVINPDPQLASSREGSIQRPISRIEQLTDTLPPQNMTQVPRNIPVSKTHLNQPIPADDTKFVASSKLLAAEHSKTGSSEDLNTLALKPLNVRSVHKEPYDLDRQQGVPEKSQDGRLLRFSDPLPDKSLLRREKLQPLKKD